LGFDNRNELCLDRPRQAIKKIKREVVEGGGAVAVDATE
jgi:hypothetical protein